ncbi:hypothetical protein [Taibaiella sp. KBW10]|uniref:hypothetical protein n=1 Tax=Taibaiella sp. KBW10 TaxID=2153357 RepID=UPI000F5AF48A|nr:hypothetical protein [Taibaiella sp. KBW10]
MKTKIKFSGLLLVLLLGFSFVSKGQTYTLLNKLNCPVEIFYELRDQGCGTPNAGSIILNTGVPLTFNVPANMKGICLIIRQIGGVPPALNHLWISLSPNPPCHNATPYGQSGTTSGCGAFIVTTTSNSWTIS